jgi:tetratricopeptide (TPR) repeat protein
LSSNDKLVEQAIAELQLLALKKPLQAYDLSKAKQMMTILRQAGYHNQEVSKLTNGAWAEPTIKAYMRGVVVNDSSINRNEVDLIADMVKTGLSFDDVNLAISLKKDLDSRGLSLKCLSSFLQGATKAGMSIDPLIRLSEDLTRILPESSIDDLASMITYKDELKKDGIGILELQNLSNVAKKYGGLSGLLNAINAFGNLKSFHDEIAKGSAQKEEIGRKLASMKVDIEAIQAKKEAIQRPLKLYEELKFEGFDQIALESLAYTCRKYNRNMKEVLEAVNTYLNLADIKQKAKEAEATKQREEKNLKDLEEKHVHFQKVLEMCNSLLYEFNYSVYTIRKLHDIVKKYGDPEEVINAVERYGELKKIHEEVEALGRKKIELESKTKEMVTRLEGLKAQDETIKEGISGLLKHMSTEIGKTLHSSMQQITSTYKEQLTVIDKKSQQDAQRQAEHMALEEEIKLGKIIRSVLFYPNRARALQGDEVVLLLHAADQYCLQTGTNPKICLDDAIDNLNNPFLSGVEVHVRQLIDGAKRGLVGGISTSKKALT